ncbi:hypothetical protein [Treponema pectinovorum]|uniref:hypothetical protein n=1 Tax=Treponema pectinovorum TaxID=164 RepID=UPI00164D826A|nr:hypothetical protein [Treponema pectinovorum]
MIDFKGDFLLHLRSAKTELCVVPLTLHRPRRYAPAVDGFAATPISVAQEVRPAKKM